MNEYINIKEIIEILEQQKPLRKDVIKALTECKGGQWRGNAYFQFVDNTNANQIGAEWQFDDNIIVEHPKKGTIIIDFLKNKKIGGLEFYELIGKEKVNTIAEFEISDCFKITGRGLVIVGDILQGTIKTENYLIVKIDTNEIKLKIKSIDYVDKRVEKTAKIGLTFFFDNVEQQAKLENLRIEKQIALIIEN